MLRAVVEASGLKQSDWIRQRIRSEHHALEVRLAREAKLAARGGATLQALTGKGTAVVIRKNPTTKK